MKEKIKVFINEYKKLSDKDYELVNSLIDLLDKDITTLKIRVKQLYNNLYYSKYNYVLFLVMKDILKEIKQLEINNYYKKVITDIEKLKTNHVYNIPLTKGNIKIVKENKDIYTILFYEYTEITKTFENIFLDEVRGILSIKKYSFYI